MKRLESLTQPPEIEANTHFKIGSWRKALKALALVVALGGCGSVEKHITAAGEKLREASPPFEINAPLTPKECRDLGAQPQHNQKNLTPECLEGIKGSEIKVEGDRGEKRPPINFNKIDGKQAYAMSVETWNNGIVEEGGFQTIVKTIINGLLPAEELAKFDQSQIDKIIKDVISKNGWKLTNAMGGLSIHNQNMQKVAEQLREADMLPDYNGDNAKTEEDVKVGTEILEMGKKEVLEDVRKSKISGDTNKNRIFQVYSGLLASVKKELQDTPQLPTVPNPAQPTSTEEQR